MPTEQGWWSLDCSSKMSWWWWSMIYKIQWKILLEFSKNWILKRADFILRHTDGGLYHNDAYYLRMMTQADHWTTRNSFCEQYTFHWSWVLCAQLLYWLERRLVYSQVLACSRIQPNQDYYYLLVLAILTFCNILSQGNIKPQWPPLVKDK